MTETRWFHNFFKLAGLNGLNVLEHVYLSDVESALSNMDAMD